MDPALLAVSIGGLTGMFIGGGLIMLFEKIRNHRYGRIVPEARVDDRDWQPMFGRPVSDWQRTFAWKPVSTLDEGYVWLKFYWRRRIHKKQFLHGGDDFWFQNVVTLRYVGI